MTHITLSNSQRRVLEDTADHPEKPAEQFATHLPGGARGKVLAALHKSGLIEKRDDAHYITDAGFAALGRERPAAPAQKNPAATLPAKTPRISKKSIMIEMLTAGTTLKALMEATGWQKHSVHGAMANLKTKDGLAIAQSKSDGADRMYKIA